MLWKLVAEIFWQCVIPCQRSIERRCRGKLHIWAEIVLPLPASHTAATGHTRLHCNAVTDLQVLYFIANFGDDTCRLVAQYHWLLNNKVSNSSLYPVVHVTAAYAGPFWLDEDIVRGLELGDRSVFISYMVFGLEDKGRILLVYMCYYWSSTRRLLHGGVGRETGDDARHNFGGVDGGVVGASYLL
jgi:hypothetical protein